MHCTHVLTPHQLALNPTWWPTAGRWQACWTWSQQSVRGVFNNTWGRAWDAAVETGTCVGWLSSDVFVLCWEQCFSLGGQPQL